MTNYLKKGAFISSFKFFTKLNALNDNERFYRNASNSTTCISKHTHTLIPTHTHTRVVLFWLLKHWSCIKLCQQHLRVDRFSDPWLLTTLKSHHPFIIKTKQHHLDKMHLKCLHDYLCASDTEEDLMVTESKWGGTLHEMDLSLGTLTVMKEEISRRGGLNVHGTIYFVPSVYRCLSWHFSIKGIRLGGAQK